MENVVTTSTWNKAFSQYKLAKCNLECAYLNFKEIDEEMAYDVKSIIGDTKDALDTLENMAPVAIRQDDFERVVEMLKTAEDEVVETPVHSEEDGRYTLIADHDNDFGWSIHLKDENGNGNHILHNVETLAELGIKWAGEDYA